MTPASLTFEAFLEVVEGLGSGSQLPTYADVIRALLEEDYGVSEIAALLDEAIDRGAIEPMPPTMGSLRYNHEETIENLMAGADLEHLGLFGDGSHYEDLFDQPDGLNSTGSGLY